MKAGAVLRPALALVVVACGSDQGNPDDGMKGGKLTVSAVPERHTVPYR